MSDKNNETNGEKLVNTHKNVFEVSSNPAPIIQLRDGNLAGDHVYLPNDVLTQQWLTKQETKSRWIDCIPVDVTDPDNFWVQLERTQRQFVKMMCDMQHFYRNYGPMVASLDKNLCAGLLVVVLRNNWYFRCRIVGVTLTYVRVHYIDYGKTGYAPKDKVYHLHREFGVLPSQAIHCKLFNLKAPTDHMLYPRTARIVTSQKIKNQLFDGYIEKQSGTGTLELSLYPVDLNSELINDWLVDQGHAEFIHTESSKS